MTETFEIKPVGVIRKGRGRVWIEIHPEYADALLGLDGFSHIYVLYWFHQNNTVENRAILQVHPRNDAGNPLTGVFATHSPVRPNLIALSLCRIQAVHDHRVELEDIDALDGSPVIDIKCYIPGEVPEVRVPAWV
jgi:tRNA-Thr(GGU) m(6)t(6)A37 methyltransferase TsaA